MNRWFRQKFDCNNAKTDFAFVSKVKSTKPTYFRSTIRRVKRFYAPGSLESIFLDILNGSHTNDFDSACIPREGCLIVQFVFLLQCVSCSKKLGRIFPTFLDKTLARHRSAITLCTPSFTHEITPSRMYTVKRAAKLRDNLPRDD